MNSKKLVTMGDWVLGFGLMAATTFLAYSYFSFGDNPNEHWKRTQECIYDELSIHWLKPEISNISAQWTNPDAPRDDYDQLVINAALLRWHLRKEAPHAFANLMQDYKRGLWNSGFADEVQSQCEKLDREWLVGRKAVVQSGDRPKIPMINAVKDIGFTIGFHENTNTTLVGSEIGIRVLASEDSTQQNYAEVYWNTVKNSEISYERCIRCTVSETGETSGSQRVLSLKVDLAQNAEWIASGSQACHIIVRPTQGTVQWKPIALTYGDSKYLPVDDITTSETFGN